MKGPEMFRFLLKTELKTSQSLLVERLCKLLRSPATDVSVQLPKSLTRAGIRNSSFRVGCTVHASSHRRRRRRSSR